jgi:hypothetical protein
MFARSHKRVMPIDSPQGYIAMSFQISQFHKLPSTLMFSGSQANNPQLGSNVSDVREDIQALFSGNPQASVPCFGQSCQPAQPAMAGQERGSILNLDAVKLPSPNAALLKEMEKGSHKTTNPPLPNTMKNPVAKAQGFPATGVSVVDAKLSEASQLSDALTAQYEQTKDPKRCEAIMAMQARLQQEVAQLLQAANELPPEALNQADAFLG